MPLTHLVVSFYFLVLFTSWSFELRSLLEAMHDFETVCFPSLFLQQPCGSLAMRYRVSVRVPIL